MPTLLQDVRYGFRMLAKNPGFTVVAVLTLALGIGANTAIFSVVNAVLLQPLPYPEADRLMVLREYELGGSSMSVNWLNFQDWLRQTRAFQEMAGYELAHFTLTGAGEPVLLRGGTVSASLFAVLGARPLLGRAFTSSDDTPQAAPTIVLSYDLWQKRFARDPAKVGRTIDLDGLAYTVVGVLPPDFRDPLRDRGVDFYIPLGLRAKRWTNRGERGSLSVVARLRPGVSLRAARGEMDTIEERLEQQYPGTNRGIRASVTPLEEAWFGSARPRLTALLVAVAFVLLIACANVANLLVARSSVRGKEFAIRQACGAGRSRVIRQLLVESVLLSSFGGAAGLLLAWWSMGPLPRLAPLAVPRLADTRLDGEVLLFTLGMSLVTGIAFGLVPAIGSSKIDVAHALKEGAGTVTRGLSHRRLRAGLLVFEIALAALLAVGSGLLMRSLLKAQEVNPGFNPDHMLVVELVFPARRYDTPQKEILFDANAVERLRALPGVRSAGAVVCPPAVGHCWDWFYEVEGRPAASGSARPVSAFNQADASYFQTAQIPLVAGRFFDERDSAHSSPVVIVNQTFAQLWWPNQSPLGKRVRLWTADATDPYREIVGLISDVKEDGLDAEQIPEVFMPLAQRPAGAVTLVMRTAGDPATAAASASDVIHQLDKDLPIQRIQPMTTYITASLGSRRFSTLLLILFAALALALAAVGTYGISAFSVTQRTHEIGVRMALGAGRGDVFRLIVRQGMFLALLGGGIGLAAALVLTRVMASLLFGVRPTDPATFGGVLLLLVAVAWLATYIPARRAAKVDPMVALRYE